MGSEGSANIDLFSLSDLFKQTLYRIPVYQRGYVWESSQLIDFWEDLIDLENRDNDHYTGMVSIKKSSEEEYKQWDLTKFIEKRNYSAYYVVDGQQRLTTSVILIKEILDFAKKHNLSSISGSSIDEIHSKYIFTNYGERSIFLFGYETDNPSDECLRYRILDTNLDESFTQNYYTNNLENAKLFFKYNLEEYCKDDVKKIDIVYSKLVNNFKFIKYEISDDIDVFVAFETMNNRGKKLSNLELLKNRLLYLTTLLDSDDDEKNSLRKEINTTWGCIYEELGSEKDKPLNDDDFLRNQWIIYFQYSRQEKNGWSNFLLKEYFTIKSVSGGKREVFVEESKTFDSESFDEDYIEKEIVDEKIEKNNYKVGMKEIKEYLTSLRNVSKYWRISFFPSSGNLEYEEMVYIKKLNNLGLGYFRPLVVASFLNHKITSAERISLFKAIERVIFLIFRMGRSMSTYRNSVYYKYAHKLAKGDAKISEVVSDLNQLFIDNMIVSVKTFTSKMKDMYNRDDGFYSWPTLKYLLYEYELSFPNIKERKVMEWEEVIKSEKDKISIEHIYPQTPGVGWDKKKFKNNKFCTNSLGNLLLLSQKVNSSFQNHTFEEKKNGCDQYPGYRKGSYSEGEVADYDDWTENTIRERGLKILAFMERRWFISFKNLEQKYDVLGYNWSISYGEDENTGPERMNQIKLELGYKEPKIVEDKFDIIDLPESITDEKMKLRSILFDNCEYVKSNYCNFVKGITLGNITDLTKVEESCSYHKKPFFIREENDDYVKINYTFHIRKNLDDKKIIEITNKICEIYGVDKNRIKLKIKKLEKNSNVNF